MLEVVNKDYYNEVVAFANKTNQMPKLQEALDYLAQFACSEDMPEYTICHLSKDFAPYSFRFVMKRKVNGEYVYWFNGGLIYHGSHDGYGSGEAPTLSVCITPTDGWSVHT